MAAASSLRHSFSASSANSHQYNLNPPQYQQAGGPKRNSGSKSAQNSDKQRQNCENLLDSLNNRNNCHGKFQRTLSLDDYQIKEEEDSSGSEKQKQKSADNNNVQRKNAKNKKLMLNAKYHNEHSISFDGGNEETDLVSEKGDCSPSIPEDNVSDDGGVQVEEEGEEEVVLRRKPDASVDEENMNETDKTGLLSSLISTSHRNSQLRSTFNKAKHHLSFEKWRSSASSSQQANSSSNNKDNSNTLNHSISNSSSNSTPNNQDGCANNSNSSNNSNGVTTPNDSSPGGRLSRWFSIRRGSSHQYDVGGSKENGGRDVRDGRLSSIDNENELKIQIQQQLHPSLSRLVTSSAALQQLQQHTTQMVNKGGKMPLVMEGDEDAYSSFGIGLGGFKSSTLKSGTLNRQNLLAPMPPAPPNLNQQQLKRRHIVAAIAHSENSYVATLHRLVNVSCT